MAIDPNIIMGIKPVQIANPLEQYMQAQQVQQAQNQNRLQDLMWNEKQRDTAADGVIASAMAKGDDVAGALARAGYGSRALAFRKTKLDVDAKQADIDKTGAETRAKQIETAGKQLDLAGQAFGWVRANPSVDNAKAAINWLQQQGVYTPEHAARDIAKVEADPGNVGQMAELAFRAALAGKDQLPKIDTRNLGGTTETFSVDPVTGQVKVVNSAKNTQSPDNAATVGASMANAAATREVAGATRDAARIQRDQATEMKLADDYRAQSKVFKETADAYKIIDSTLSSAAKSAPATLAAATKFMKLLDPGSVVRESELGMALASTGVIDKMLNYVNRLQRGQVLTPSQVTEFKTTANQIYKAAQEAQQEIDQSYRRQTQTYGLRPEMVIQDLGQNRAPAPAAGKDAANNGWTITEVR